MVTNSTFPATAMPDADWWTALWPDPEGTLRKLGIGEGQTIVDLCCGDGLFTVPLCRLLGERGRLYALDMDPAMLAAAQKLMAQDGPDFAVEVCSWIKADACRVDERLDGRVDTVLMANTFHGVPDKKALAETVRRVLKSDGQFILINWHARPRDQTTVLDQPRGPKTEMRMPPDEVGSILSAAGFVLADVVELPPYHYGAVFRVAMAFPEG